MRTEYVDRADPKIERAVREAKERSEESITLGVRGCLLCGYELTGGRWCGCTHWCRCPGCEGCLPNPDLVHNPCGDIALRDHEWCDPCRVAQGGPEALTS